MITRFGFTTALLCVLQVMFLALMPVQAAEVKGLYTADVPVRTQTDDERLQAIRTGLGIVLVKVSGRREAPTLPAIQALLESPMVMVQQFRYHSLPEQWQNNVDEQGRFYSQLLRISYDSQAVNQALRDAGLPVWGRARPSTLVWLAVENWNQRSVLGAATLPDLRDALVRQADQRGLPLLFPLLDLEDQGRLGFADIWGDFQDTILPASGRYHAEGVLVGRLYRQTANQWQARWTLYQNEEVLHWMSEGGAQQQALDEGLNQAADRLAERFARMPGDAGNNRVSLKVQDVASLEAYSRVMKYLESLDISKAVLVDSVAGNSATFSLTVRGTQQDLEQAIAFGDILAPVRTEDGIVTTAVDGSPVADDSAAVAVTVLSYRLLP